ncbi:hypothetical protein M0R45_027900 [Rubus argutus]|uniref:F-box domain-containing protein n=1 Tax=Rubus argutus TaxID=59490 RepID=A0AAW1W2V3_RUBAR
MKKVAVMMELPEGCIANVLSLTTPRDACRLSAISRDFKSYPAPNQSAAIDAKSKKELYISLSDNPILIDGGKMSFSLDKWSGKKCYMIAAKHLRIAWGNTPRYWEWISLPESRFKEGGQASCCMLA